MSAPIEDYAMIGNMRTAALVSRNSSIDWLCLPRFDSPACFASLLGTGENGRWLITSASEARSITRQYQGNTMILATDLETADGRVQLVDFMPILRGKNRNSVIRMVHGISGIVRMRMELSPKFEYGRIIPRLRRVAEGVVAIAAPNGMSLNTPVDLLIRESGIESEFVVAAGQTVTL
jgi:GH15 family glucan-1,4-alpha-glucosidase